MTGKTSLDPKSLKPVLEQIDRIDVDPLTKIVASTTALVGGDPVPILVAGISAKLTEEAEARNPIPEVPEDYDMTERTLAEMLWENTGCSPLDSGFYGRHWEKNRQIKDFRSTPVVLVDRDYVLINIWHYLRTFLERDDVSKRLEERFYDFANRPENRDKPWIELMIEFAKKLRREGFRYVCADNSANWEHYLSQDIQFVMVEHEKSGKYLFLQIHNGADLRGGYTRPRVFKLWEENDGDFFFKMDELWANCRCTHAYIHRGHCEAYSDDDGTKYDHSPEHWVWDENANSYRCDRCKSPVEFHHEIEDGF